MKRIMVEFSEVKKTSGLTNFLTERIEVEECDISKVKWPENAYRARFLVEENERCYDFSPYYYYEGQFIKNDEPPEEYKYCDNPLGFVRTKFGQIVPLKKGDVVL